MPEQPDKCREHHMLLKREIENFKKEFDDLIKNCKDMHCFFFGGYNQSDGHISFVDKVNTLYENQRKARTFLYTFLSAFGVLIISGFVGLGIQLQKIDKTAQDLQYVMQKQAHLEISIAKIEEKIK